MSTDPLKALALESIARDMRAVGADTDGGYVQLGFTERVVALLVACGAQRKSFVCDRPDGAIVIESADIRLFGVRFQAQSSRPATEQESRTLAENGRDHTSRIANL